jgi:hypothetical protein
MSCRKLGFAAPDFDAMTMPELYLRLCLACEKED